MAITFSSDIRFIKGVGESKMKLYEKLQIFCVEDLLYHIPRSYIDLTSPLSLSQAKTGEICTFIATVAGKSGEQVIRKGLSLFKVSVVDEKDTAIITFYNGKYTVAGLEIGKEYLFHGRLGGSLYKKEIQSPMVFPTSAEGLVPVYPLTAGITSRTISNHIATALSSLDAIPESLPLALRKRGDVIPISSAILNLHFPNSLEDVTLARKRLAFDELLCVALGVSRTGKQKRQSTIPPMKKQDLSPLFDSLPFDPTNAQWQAIQQSMEDMESGMVMNRLIQGDVGSGKTLVATASCYFAFLNGFACAMMAPTEILAEQHYKNLTPILEPLGMKLGLLTGSLSAKNKRELKKQLLAGEIDLCIGTHALITQDTQMKNLGLVITDEQHRFGVAQRMALTKKGESVHTLVMSATPIPRTLGLILYGDMEISIIKELPRGRQTIDTFLIDSEKRTRAWGYIKNHLDKGLQGYIVCPLVEDDPETNTAGRHSAIEWAEELSAEFFRDYTVGLLHGKMKPKEKDAVMSAFARGEIQLLVATTVIEVGIDVANATIMMIENGESFGLSQLHQLRGRVGRGTEKSTCILVTDSQNLETVERLKTICQNSDGFAIAEYDMLERGIGDFFGLRQHGIPTMCVASLTQDSQLLEVAKETADYILEKDPHLTHLPVLCKRINKIMGTAAVL